MIRAQIEYASVVYGSMLTANQSGAVERLQAVALRTIWGWEKSYRECLNLSGLERLDERRKKNTIKFAQRTSQNPRYEHWFPTNNTTQYDLRRQERFHIRFARHERLRNAPIYAMRRMLNDEDANTQHNDRDDESDGVE